MKYKPGDLRFRVELLRPTNAKSLTGNTTGAYSSYATRYAAIPSAAGNDANHNDQDIGTRVRVFVVRYDAAIRASWVVRYDSTDYYLERPPVDPDAGAKRYLELYGVAVDGITLIS